MNEPRIQIPTCIVGARFRGLKARDAIARMAVFLSVTLERDPENPHDANAVKCLFLGVHVGFIPKQSNPRIAAALDAGRRVDCMITKLPSGRITEPSVIVSWTDE